MCNAVTYACLILNRVRSNLEVALRKGLSEGNGKGSKQGGHAGELQEEEVQPPSHSVHDDERGAHSKIAANNHHQHEFLFVKCGGVVRSSMCIQCCDCAID